MMKRPVGPSLNYSILGGSEEESVYAVCCMAMWLQYPGAVSSSTGMRFYVVIWQANVASWFLNVCIIDRRGDFPSDSRVVRMRICSMGDTILAQSQS